MKNSSWENDRKQRLVIHCSGIWTPIAVEVDIVAHNLAIWPNWAVVQGLFNDLYHWGMAFPELNSPTKKIRDVWCPSPPKMNFGCFFFLDLYILGFQVSAEKDTVVTTAPLLWWYRAFTTFKVRPLPKWKVIYSKSGRQRSETRLGYIFLFRWSRWIPMIFFEVIIHSILSLFISLPSWFTHIVLSRCLKYIKDPLLPELPERLCTPALLVWGCWEFTGTRLMSRNPRRKRPQNCNEMLGIPKQDEVGGRSDAQLVLWVFGEIHSWRRPFLIIWCISLPTHMGYKKYD